MQDLFLLFLTFVSSIFGAWLYTKILNNNISVWFALVSGITNTFLWVLMMRYSSKSLIGLSAWFDAVSALGYFVGFIVLGQSISAPQIIGIFLLTIGLILINNG